MPALNAIKKSPITRATLLSAASILISAGVVAINVDLRKGAILIILGVALLIIREYFKSIPEE
jgi:hypothetical protein